MKSEIKFSFFPNVKTKFIASDELAASQSRIVELVKKILNLSNDSSYREVKISLIYNDQNVVKAILVYLLSSQHKSFETVKINLTDNFKVISIEKNYQVQLNDLMQSEAYAENRAPKCPNQKVQFIVGNNFGGDASVEKETVTVYLLAQAKGYRPVFMDTNNPKGPLPTIQSYENWLSCTNVKGFYNESHGSTHGILLEDGELLYSHVEKDLVGKLKDKIVLFDSCSTFNDPLLSAMIHPEKGNAQQYVAGIVPLPFGASERVASCFWWSAFKSGALTQDLIENCSDIYHLEHMSFRIAGNGDDHLRPAG